MKYIKKVNNKNFIILNLSDIQITSKEWKNKEYCYQLFIKTVDKLIKKYNPNMITITGDLVFCEDYEGYKLLTNYMTSLKIPWAPIFGNHDNEKGYNISNKQADILLSSSTCLFEKGDKKLGCGNYVITILNENDKPIEGLIFMDTQYGSI